MAKGIDTTFRIDDSILPTAQPGRLSQAAHLCTGRATQQQGKMETQLPIATWTCLRSQQQGQQEPPVKDPNDDLPPLDILRSPEDSPQSIPRKPPATAPLSNTQGFSMNIALKPSDAIVGPLDFSNKVHVLIYKAMSKELPA